MKNRMLEQFYISSICDDAIMLSKKYGFGIEATEYSYAENMDRFFEQTHPKVQNYKDIVNNLLFHAPFYDLSMAAIDSKIKDISFDRFVQFINITQKYDAKKLIFHSGYNPHVYYKEWFEPNATDFLRKLVKNCNTIFCLENVFSKTPEMIYNIVSHVNMENLKICLDIGHINAYADRVNGLDNDDLVCYWIERLAPLISHFHIHNNFGTVDSHNDIFEGKLNIKKIIEFSLVKCPNATYTIEVSKINDFAREVSSMFK